MASINYRLSHQGIFPAQLIDCKTAIAWIRANAAQYKIDPDKVAVWGSSAGGHLAAMVGTTAGWDGVSKVIDRDSRVRAVVDYYGPTEYVTSDDAPFFIVHGTSDPVVPPAQSQLIHDKLVAQRVQSELTFLPGAGHGGPAFTDAALLDRVAVFIRRAFAN